MVRVLTHLAVGFVIHIFTLREGMFEPVLHPFAYPLTSSPAELIIDGLHLWLSGCFIIETFTVIVLSDVVGLRLQRALGMDAFGVWFLQSRMALDEFLKACNRSDISQQQIPAVLPQQQQIVGKVDGEALKVAIDKILTHIVSPMATFNMMLVYMYVAAVICNVIQQAMPTYKLELLFTYFGVTNGIVVMALYQIASSWCYQPARELLNVAYTKIKDEHYLIGRKLQNATVKQSSQQVLLSSM